jgi:putative transposase
MLTTEMRQEILDIITYAKEHGIGKYQTCKLLQINIRRIERWEAMMQNRGSIAYLKPGPKQVTHAIMPREQQELLRYARKEPIGEYSFKMLSLKGAEEGYFVMSASTVRQILQEKGLADERASRRNRIVAGKKQIIPCQLTAPNQCWSWDICFLHTEHPEVYWYLYVVVDEWSRKVISWRISRTKSDEETAQLIDNAYLAEHLLNIAGARLPIIINGRGSKNNLKQMKQMFADMGLAQPPVLSENTNSFYMERFARNPEKAPRYPGLFQSNDAIRVQDYFEQYFGWYNQQHYHSRIGYVTPVQKHEGLATATITERKRLLAGQKETRKLYWSSQQISGYRAMAQ